jgi:hypothetical protein
LAHRPDIAQAVERISQYALHDDWSEHRRAHAEAMLGDVLDDYGLDLQDCLEEVDALGLAGRLVDFLNESFLAARFGKQRANVIDAYLKQRGWQETPRAREYLQAMRDTPVSLYEVQDLLPGEWIDLKDVVRGGALRRVNEKLGSQDLKRWDRLAARVVVAKDETMLTGGVLALTHDTGAALEAFLGRRRKNARIGDHIFLQAWLQSLLDYGRRPPPGLTNTDGETLLLTKTRLPAGKGAAPKIAQRMDALEGWEREQDEATSWLWQPGPDTPRTIHAVARLADGALVIETNSRERMERALTMLRPAFGPLVGEGLTSHEDPMQLLRHAAPRRARDSADEELAGPEVEAALRQFKDAHYRRVLDEPVPMLGNKTPRACARTKAGRARLVRWLRELENGELHSAAAAGRAAYDFEWLWQELGVRPDGS